MAAEIIHWSRTQSQPRAGMHYKYRVARRLLPSKMRLVQADPCASLGTQATLN